MKRSVIIATCLLNSGIVPRLEDGEQAVRTVFQDEYPGEQFPDWDREVDQSAAAHVITTVGRASRINVAKFIEDLRDS